MILVVEDDPRIGGPVSEALRAAGHDVRWVGAGQAAIEEARAAPPDLILLDLGLPDLDGLEVCTVLRREHHPAVIIMMTARGEDMDVIVGLESGADDYVAKPFGLTVLLARVQAHLRRAAPPGTPARVIVLGDLRMDTAARRASLGGHEIALRNKHFDLLERLARDLGTAVPRSTLMAEVWDANWSGSTKTLDVHIASLRQVLADESRRASSLTGRPVLVPRVVTVRDVGYQLDGPRTEQQPAGSTAPREAV